MHLSADWDLEAKRTCSNDLAIWFAASDGCWTLHKSHTHNRMQRWPRLRNSHYFNVSMQVRLLISMSLRTFLNFLVIQHSLLVNLRLQKSHSTKLVLNRSSDSFDAIEIAKSARKIESRLRLLFIKIIAWFHLLRNDDIKEDTSRLFVSFYMSMGASHC
jgi:hypothetical protein